MTSDGLHLPDALIDVTLPRLKMAKGDDLGIVLFGDTGHGKSIVVDIKTDVVCARLWHG
jgi:hypothetical protein